MSPVCLTAGAVQAFHKITELSAQPNFWLWSGNNGGRLVCISPVRYNQHACIHAL